VDLPTTRHGGGVPKVAALASVRRNIPAYRFDVFDAPVPKVVEALIGVVGRGESLGRRAFGRAPERVQALLLLELAGETRGLLNPEACAARCAEGENDSECEY
jgi:hypothetical protein